MSRVAPLLAARPSRQLLAGFTLLELMVALGLAALAAAVVGGGGQAYLERARYQHTVRELASQLKNARAFSLDHGQSVLVSYQPQTRTLRVDGQAPVTMPEGLDVRWQALGELRPGRTAPGVEPIFLFNADGSARGGQISVSRAGRGVRFEVNWLLGTMESSTVTEGG